MGGPTWPPTPEDAHAATIEEYGDLARQIIEGAGSDEEAETALLSHFLFAPPQRALCDGVDDGTPLQVVQGHLEPWLRMVTGLDFQIAIAEPAGTNGTDLYLPSTAPSPVDVPLDEALFRTMSLVQLGFIRFGLLNQRRLLAELHADWVLRSVWTLLAARYVVRRWSEDWPGIAVDFAQVRQSTKATDLRVGHQSVPRKGLPAAFCPLYEGLVDGLQTTDPSAGPAREATTAVDEILTDAAAPLVLMGQAQRLREHLHGLRLGPPPLPLHVGLLRPAWMLEDLAAEMAAASEWRQGNKPLRPLLAAISRGRGADVAAKLKRRLGGTGPGPDWQEEPVPPRRASDDALLYDQWDDSAGRYQADATRILLEDASTGPIEAYQRIEAAMAGQIPGVRREFDALRVEERWRHAQADGSDLDLSRVVAAMADLKAGHTPRTDWYQRFERRPRSLSILTMVDQSGSTQGAVIHEERAALVLFSEGLRVLGVPHAFFGFSSQGPQRCRWLRIKDWEDAHGPAVQKRIGNLAAQGGTRLGAFIRHATAVLDGRPEERRVMMVISDGRPEDGDAYRGRAGIRDTALAVRTARSAGIHVVCISLDTREGADDYLTEIFGRGRYLVLDGPETLPTRLPEVFRDLMR